MNEDERLRRMAWPGSSTGCSSAWAGAPCASCIPIKATSPSAPCARACFSLSPFFTGRGSRRSRASGTGEGQQAAPASAAAPHPNPLPMPEEAWGEGTPRLPARCSCCSSPEAADVMAVVPDGPPRHFRWRGVLLPGGRGARARAHRAGMVAAARPRRRATITSSRIRPGRRFWLYRAGLYGRSDTTPQWFVHGVFA